MGNPLSNWRIAWENRFYRWLDQRSPNTHSITLNRKNLYTFPNVSGLMYLVIIVVIWMLGTNYQNNLILALAYLMISIFIVAILHAFTNMAGITVTFAGAKPAFAGEPAAFTLELTAIHKFGCDHLELRWPGGDTQLVTLNANEPVRINLHAQSKERGYLRPGRLLLQSHFPLGIIRCWTWLNLDAQALIYPAPIASEEPKHQASDGKQEGGSRQRGGDDFSGLRDYQPGDPIKHIAWKQFAQEKGLFTKEYEAFNSAEKWLDWNSLTLPQEARLSGFCYWALEYEQRQIPYGLRLPGITLEPALGEAHLQAVLTAMAQFNLPAPVLPKVATQ
ncbi:DUF58 domain-containing protein [Cellvibrio mixtus]|uniref:DUF58 domain-containing protein n=1 Tax=Cellvibrio mixtus TaxID=39650 RepID=UPI000586DE0E|nr:DUF58 domain-containing protein [Cellvibrio mixtus]